MSINIATAQYPITKHESFDSWRLHIHEWIADAVAQKAKLLLFPEYGSMELVSILPQEGVKDIRKQVLELQKFRSEYCSVFSEQAKKWDIIIVAPSFPVLEEGNVYNRAYVFSAKGLVGYQDKFFMTRFEDEEWGIRSGPKVLTLFEADWGNFGIQICYDIEFALGSQLLNSAGASLTLVPSSTEAKRGATRVHLGARARALESQAYTVVSQTVGEAHWSPAIGVSYGYTAIYCAPDLYMPEEGIVNTMPAQQTGWLLQSLNLKDIEKVRNGGKVFNFKDHQRFHLEFPDEDISIIRKQV